MALVAEDRRSKMKKELEDYVQSVAALEYENAELKSRIEELAAEKERDLDAWTGKMKSAKESWRSQALTHGSKQREKAIKECEQVMLSFQSELRTQRFATDVGNRASVISALIRSRYGEGKWRRKVGMYEAIASTGISTSNVGLQDFDIEDHHIGVFNKTDDRVNLTGCVIKFRVSGSVYHFPEGTLVEPKSVLSLWYGKEHSQVRRCKEAGSLLWSSEKNVITTLPAASLSSTEVAELVDRKGTVRSHLQCTKTSSSSDEEKQRLLVPHIEEEKPSSSSSSSSSSRASLGAVKSAVQNSSKKRQRGGKDKDLEEVVEGTVLEGSSSAPPSKSSRKSLSSASASSTHKSNTSSSSNEDLVVAAASSAPSQPLEQRPAASPAASPHPHSLSDPLAYKAPRPFLHGRQQGALQIDSVLKNGFKIVIRLRNRSSHAVDISGWKLVCLGYPVQELLIPRGSVVPARGPLGIVSQLDESAKLLVRGAAGISPHDADVAVAGVTAAGEGGQAVVSNGKAVVAKPKKGAANTAGTGSAVEEAAAERQHLFSFSEAHIVEIMGLNTLSVCDVFALCLVDTDGENICQIDAVSNDMDIFGEKTSHQSVNARTWRSWLVPVYRTLQSFVSPFLFDSPAAAAASANN